MSWLSERTGLDKMRALRDGLNAVLRLVLTPEVEAARVLYLRYAKEQGLTEEQARAAWAAVVRLAKAPGWME